MRQLFQIIETSPMTPIEFRAANAIIADTENSVWILSKDKYTRLPGRFTTVPQSDRVAYHDILPHTQCFFFIDDDQELRIRIMPRDHQGPYGIVTGVILSVCTMLWK